MNTRCLGFAFPTQTTAFETGCGCSEPLAVICFLFILNPHPFANQLRIQCGCFHCITKCFWQCFLLSSIVQESSVVGDLSRILIWNLSWCTKEWANPVDLKNLEIIGKVLDALDFALRFGLLSQEGWSAYEFVCWELHVFWSGVSDSPPDDKPAILEEIFIPAALQKQHITWGARIEKSADWWILWHLSELCIKEVFPCFRWTRTNKQQLDQNSTGAR